MQRVAEEEVLRQPRMLDLLSFSSASASLEMLRLLGEKISNARTPAAAQELGL